MHQDSFRSVVCRSLSKRLPSRSKDGSHEAVHPVGTGAQKATNCVVTLEPTACRSCRGRDWNREERAMSSYTERQMAASLPRHFAEDLLQGAMDLGESLAMLREFQATARSVRRAHKKRKPEAAEVDASDDCTHQLKQVIRDSFYRQNLLLPSPGDERASSTRSLLYSLLSSSSGAKTPDRHAAPPMPSSSCASTQSDISNSPGLIAKLMGLDETPREEVHLIKRTISSPRARFDIEMPRPRKPLQSSGDHPGPNRKAMQEIAETMQFKGLLKSGQPDEPGALHHQVPMNSPCSEEGIAQGRTLLSDDISVTSAAKPVKSVQEEGRIQQSKAGSCRDAKAASPARAIKNSKKASEKPKPTSAEKKGEERKSTNPKTLSVSRHNSAVSRHNSAVVPKTDKKSIASSNGAKEAMQKSPNATREKKMVASRRTKNSASGKALAEGKKCAIQIRTIDDPNRSAGFSDAELCIEDEVQKDWSTPNAELPASKIRRSNTLLVQNAEIKDDLSLLLLSDPSFLRRAQELVGAGTYQHLSQQSDSSEGLQKSQMKKHYKLYLDAAAEQLERRQQQQAAFFSLEDLLKDVTEGIRGLNSYADDDRAAGDGLYMKLERDLRCRDASISSMWDVGWQDWICMEEAECFVRDVGEQILSALIEELSVDVSD